MRDFLISLHDTIHTNNVNHHFDFLDNGLDNVINTFYPKDPMQSKKNVEALKAIIQRQRIASNSNKNNLVLDPYGIIKQAYIADSKLNTGFIGQNYIPAFNKDEIKVNPIYSFTVPSEYKNLPSNTQYDINMISKCKRTEYGIPGNLREEDLGQISVEVLGDHFVAQKKLKNSEKLIYTNLEDTLEKLKIEKSHTNVVRKSYKKMADFITDERALDYTQLDSNESKHVIKDFQNYRILQNFHKIAYEDPDLASIKDSNELYDKSRFLANEKLNHMYENIMDYHDIIPTKDNHHDAFHLYVKNDYAVYTINKRSYKAYINDNSFNKQFLDRNLVLSTCILNNEEKVISELKLSAFDRIILKPIALNYLQKVYLYEKLYLNSTGTEKVYYLECFKYETIRFNNAVLKCMYDKR